MRQAFAFLPQFLVFSRGGEKASRFRLAWKDLKPCLTDATPFTGFDRHYIFHTAWAARILAETRPNTHIDISSSLYFVGCVSAFVPITFLDYRPANLYLSGLTEGVVNLSNLQFQSNSLKSLSCMHVVEHIGLGRYADTLDYDGDLIACKELTRVLAPGGQLLFVVPIGAEAKIMFNAHRIYTYSQVAGMFNDLVVEQFCLIPESAADGELVPWPSETLLQKQIYGCGCFLFRKPLNEKVKVSQSE